MQLLERKLRSRYYRESYNAVIGEKVTMQLLDRKLKRRVTVLFLEKKGYSSVMREEGYSSIITEEGLH